MAMTGKSNTSNSIRVSIFFIYSHPKTVKRYSEQNTIYGLLEASLILENVGERATARNISILSCTFLIVAP